MLSLKHLYCHCKQIPERHFIVPVTRHLTHFATSQSSSNVGNDSKAPTQNYPSVSSYYKVNNQSAIDTAAGKVSFIVMVIFNLNLIYLS